MTKGVQLWPGDSMRAFYRRHIERETALDAAATERLVEALTRATNRMLVWEMPAEAQPAPRVSVKSTETKDKAPAAKAKGTKSGPSAKEAPKPAPAEPAKAAPAAPPAQDPLFDPYAFSAMVVLTKQGREGLAARLAQIATLEHLRRFADAQHLGFDRSLTKLDDVRKALLAAAEQRLASRRAAAS